MIYLRKRVLSGERVFGSWCGLGSSVAAEIAGKSGLDWVLLDREHGVGSQSDLLHQLQAVSATPAAPIVRVPWNDPVFFKQVLDLGASGVMVPYVQSAQEATNAVRAMRYPPDGIRGVAKMHRAAGFGRGFVDYAARANSDLLTVVQVETPAGVEAASEIAAVDGVDVLFVGPLDLSTGMGIQDQYDHPDFLDALSRVGDAARAHGKAAGILLLSAKMLPTVLDRGYSFIAMGIDGAMIAKGMADVVEAFRPHRS